MMCQEDSRPLDRVAEAGLMRAKDWRKAGQAVSFLGLAHFEDVARLVILL